MQVVTEDAPKGKLVTDIKETAVSDAEELLRATADQAGEKISELRARMQEMQERLSTAKDTLNEKEHITGDLKEEAMSDITRPELDARLELIEAKMDARVARIETAVEQIKEATGEAKNFKWWAAAAAVSSVIGLYAANVSLLQGFIAAFESGRNVGQQQTAPPPNQRQKP